MADDFSDAIAKGLRDRARMAELGIKSISPPKRNKKGQYVKGTSSPHPIGRPPEKKRMFMKSQTVEDLLRLLEQPITITKDKRSKKVPAILAIYDRMIYMAIGGDWNAMRKCIELREKYTDFRENLLKQLLQQAIDIRGEYKARSEEIPPEVMRMVELVENTVMSGQYRPA